MKRLYITVWTIKHRTYVNIFAYETAEINIEVKFSKTIYVFYDYICRVENVF